MIIFMVFALLVVMIYGIIDNYEMIHFINCDETRFGNPFSKLWFLCIACFILLFAGLLLRKYLQNKYTRLAQEQANGGIQLTSGVDYYYQLPVIKLVDRMPIPIQGRRKAFF